MTNKVGQRERATQNRVVQFFQNELHYDYLGNWEDQPRTSNIETDLLRRFLVRRGVSDNLIERTLTKITQVAGDQTKNIYTVNKSVYTLLRYGVNLKPAPGQNKVTIDLIDWANPLNNHFAIAEEVTVKGEHTKRPDIVMYVNGIAVGVIELKRSTVSVSEGIRQNLDNQKQMFIERFFTTMQLVMAGNDTEGVRYGTIETPEKYYLQWKEPSEIANLMERHLTQLCSKERLLEIIHDFIVFDRGDKKVCRPNQYFGVKATQQRLRILHEQDDSTKAGILWHTQGSGKSLTMVWLAKWIRENVTDARVLIVTDRDELDKQIEKVFKGVEEKIYRTRSGSDLLRTLNAPDEWLVCSLIHKFGGKEDGDVQGYIADIQKHIPSDFRAKGNIFVFVDECHRTQSGILHDAMKQFLPDAVFIGFTGTPLLSDAKKPTIATFGSFIHTYKYDEAVRDGVVLDLRYEARDIDQSISSESKIDQWFDAKTRGLNDIAKAQLKKKWGTLQKVFSSRSRLERIVADIILDMGTRDRLQSGNGNALLVTSSIYEACKFYELFQRTTLAGHCAIVTSYDPSPQDVKGETTGEGETEKIEQYDIYTQMLNGKTVTQFEEDVKLQFIEEPAKMKLLIVVDKLLTGFDAPPATFLYIDKQMRDHNLFQAICRVNRLDGSDKEYGYIIDYKDLFYSLEKSVQDYTSGAFDAYDADDIQGVLSDRFERDRERLEETLEQIRALCEPVAQPKETVDYIKYFCGADSSDQEELRSNESKRLTLYKYTVALLRAYANLANDMEQAGFSETEAQAIKTEVEHYESVRTEIKLASGDYIDLKSYEPAMRHLIDTYIRADESEKISAFDDTTLVHLIVDRGVDDAVDALPESVKSNPEAVAETITNNVRKIIIDENPINPKYYDRMSELLDALTEQRRKGAIEYADYLREVASLAKQVIDPATTTSYPETINSTAKRSLYDNLDQDESVAIDVHEAILANKYDGWRGNKLKEKALKRAINRALPEDMRHKLDKIFAIVKSQSDY